MKSKLTVFILILSLCSISRVFSFNNKDAKNFAQSFVIANLLKRLIKNDTLTSMHKNALSFFALSSYALHVHESSPKEEKIRNSISTAGGLMAGTLAKDTWSLFETLFAGFVALGLIDFIFD